MTLNVFDNTSPEARVFTERNVQLVTFFFKGHERVIELHTSTEYGNPRNHRPAISGSAMVNTAV